MATSDPKFQLHIRRHPLRAIRIQQNAGRRGRWRPRKEIAGAFVELRLKANRRQHRSDRGPEVGVIVDYMDDARQGWRRGDDHRPSPAQAPRPEAELSLNLPGYRRPQALGAEVACDT